MTELFFYIIKIYNHKRKLYMDNYLTKLKANFFFLNYS